MNVAYAPDALHMLRDSFALHLDAYRSDSTQRIYLSALDRLIGHLEAQGMPTGTLGIRREHVESRRPGAASPDPMTRRNMDSLLDGRAERTLPNHGWAPMHHPKSGALVGFGGLGVFSGFGLGVGLGVLTGLASAVGLGVASGVGEGVDAAVGAGVGPEVGVDAAVGLGVGCGVRVGVEPGVGRGDCVARAFGIDGARVASLEAGGVG